MNIRDNINVRDFLSTLMSGYIGIFGKGGRFQSGRLRLQYPRVGDVRGGEEKLVK